MQYTEKLDDSKYSCVDRDLGNKDDHKVDT